MSNRGLLVVALASLVACDPGGMADGEMMAAADEDASPRGCEAETRADVYTLGMAKAGERIAVTFVDALPAPPARGDNRWRVAISEGGVPLADLAIEVEPFMPDHMHGTSIEAHATATDVAGEYVIEPVDLFMPGLWEVTLFVGLADGGSDEVQVAFCVDP